VELGLLPSSSTPPATPTSAGWPSAGTEISSWDESTFSSVTIEELLGRRRPSGKDDRSAARPVICPLPA